MNDYAVIIIGRCTPGRGLDSKRVPTRRGVEVFDHGFLEES